MLFFILDQNPFNLHLVHLNTSHVILYPVCRSILMIPHLHLNTSHVILYRGKGSEDKRI